MGGTIKIVLRDTDGKVYADTRWTNPYPHFIRHEKFIAADHDYLMGYVNEEDDYRENDHTLGPVSYGIMVIDNINKTILAANDYSITPDRFVGLEINRLFLGAYYGGVRKPRELENLNEYERGERAMWERLADRGLLTAVDERRKLPSFPIPSPGETIAQSIERMNDMQNDIYFMFKLDISPWKVEAFGDSEKDFASVKARMVELGFTFSAEDEAAWQSYIADHFHDE